MKKGLVLVAIAGILVFSGLIYGINMILEQSDDVQVSCEVLKGDAAAAEGISFRIGNQLQEGLYWDSYITLHEKTEDIEMHTVFEDKWKQRSDNVNYFGSSLYDEIVSIYSANDYVVWNGGIIDFSAISHHSTVLFTQEEMEAIAERTQPGETYTEEIPLNNYMTYYDVDMSTHLSAGSYYVVGDMYDRVKNFFEIQVPDSHMYKISITKDKDGRIVQVGCGSESLAFKECGVQTSDGLYFGFYGVKEERVEDLTMGSGNGIFRIPLKTAEKESDSGDNSETVIYYNQLANVFPLPEKDCYPLEILTDEAEENLFLLTSENKKAVLRIIDKETMTEKQKLELMDFNGILGHNGYEQQMDLHDEGIVIIINDNSFCFVTKKDGIYKKQIVTNLGEGLGQSNEYLYDLAYQNDKLILLVAKSQIWNSEVYLHVLSEKGIEYTGLFVPSFSYDRPDVHRVHLRKDNALEILESNVK